MTVVFGALTTQFTNYGLALAESTSSPEAAARLEEVKQSLFRQVNKDVLYLVYIGEFRPLVLVELIANLLPLHTGFGMRKPLP